MEETTKQVSKEVTPPHLRNPTGKGGFGDNPENRSNGHWNSKDIFNYQLNRFMNMTAKEFKEFGKTPDDKMTMAERTAYIRVANAKDLNEYKDTADRLQGKAQQFVDQTTNGENLPTPIVSISALRDLVKPE